MLMDGVGYEGKIKIRSKYQGFHALSKCKDGATNNRKGKQRLLEKEIRWQEAEER